MKESVYLPVTLLTVIKQSLHYQLWALWQMASLSFHTNAWQGLVIVFADALSY